MDEIHQLEIAFMTMKGECSQIYELACSEVLSDGTLIAIFSNRMKRDRNVKVYFKNGILKPYFGNEV
jgi:hypothetical protein